MFDFNQLIMAIIIGFLLLAVNAYLPIAPLINLVFNFFMLAALVIYLMQFMGVITGVLPACKLFKPGN